MANDKRARSWKKALRHTARHGARNKVGLNQVHSASRHRLRRCRFTSPQAFTIVPNTYDIADSAWTILVPRIGTLMTAGGGGWQVLHCTATATVSTTATATTTTTTGIYYYNRYHVQCVACTQVSKLPTGLHELSHTSSSSKLGTTFRIKESFSQQAHGQYKCTLHAAPARPNNKRPIRAPTSLT